MSKIWSCKIGETDELPAGADAPMRQAVLEAYRKLARKPATFCFSGWGAELTESERAVVENREPINPTPSPHRALREALEELANWAGYCHAHYVTKNVIAHEATVEVMDKEFASLDRAIQKAHAALPTRGEPR